MNKVTRLFAKSANIWRGLVTTFLVLTLIAFFLTQFAFANKKAINSFLGLSSSKSVETGDAVVANHFKSDFAADVKNPTAEEFAALKEASKQQAIKEMEEGAVLLKNDNNALPLAKGAKVSLFGHGSEQPMYKPFSGSPATWPSVDVKTAMTDAEFEINQTLYNAYASARSSGSYGGGTRSDDYAAGSWLLYEVSKDFYAQAGLRDTYANYNDAAIVFITRTGGEDRDCPTGRSEYDAPGFTVEDSSLSYLELQQNEKDMLNEVKANFEKIIVVLNTANPMELGWLDEYDVDACLWVGGYGHYGTIGMANILCGDVNPSGRLVDTYAYDSLSAPAMTNFGNFSYTNAGSMLTAQNGVTDGGNNTQHYVVYAEGIYIGYKYYETRYEDVILGRGDASSDIGSSTGDYWNYAEEVQFPFGYGLSYTDFSLELVSGSYNENNVGSEFTFEVKVTNTGNTAGRRSVQLYFQAPYEDYGVEKSAIQLVGFGKTGELAPKGQQGDSETITITVDKYLLASYDYEVAEGYILDAGDYYFAVGDSVHDALNYVLKEKEATGMKNIDGGDFKADSLKKVWKWNQAELDTETYRYSRYGEKVEVTNRLHEVDLNYWIEDGVTYLSRSDWSGTYPTEPTQITLTAEMAREIGGNYYEELIPEDAPSVSDFTQGAENGIPFVSMYGVDYDDDIWEDFLDQLSIEEMLSVTVEYFQSSEVISVNKPFNYNNDGPDGIRGGFNIFDENGEKLPEISGECTMFVNEVVLASTYNYDLIRNRGNMMGEESMFATCPQMWSPGANLHRTPYNGRHFEYYSEDSNLAYLCTGVEVKAMRAKGVVTAIKHFVGNNQETNRRGLSTFSNEQAFRMNDMRAFEGAFTVGGANSTMTSYNRVGMRTLSQNDVMQEEILRGEWGFKGVIISDAVAGYMHPRESLIAGNDMWCMCGEGHIDSVRQAIANGDGFMLQNLRRANKNYYYAYCNSNLTNGLSATTKIISIKNWWEYTLDTINLVLLILTVITGVLFIGSTVTRTILARKEKANV